MEGTLNAERNGERLSQWLCVCLDIVFCFRILFVNRNGALAANDRSTVAVDRQSCIFILYIQCSFT